MFEMFDDEEIKSKNEIDFLSQNINKKELVNNATKYYTNRIHDLICNNIPFFKTANTSIRHDGVIYRFGKSDNTLAITISGEIISDKYHKNAVELHFYTEKNGICTNRNDSGDLIPVNKLISYLNDCVPLIKKEYGSLKSFKNLN